MNRDGAYDLVEGEIEELRPSAYLGTRLEMIQMDNKLVIKHGLKPNSEREFTWVWVIACGRAYYGSTIRQAISRALAGSERG